MAIVEEKSFQPALSIETNSVANFESSLTNDSNHVTTKLPTLETDLSSCDRPLTTNIEPNGKHLPMNSTTNTFSSVVEPFNALTLYDNIVSSEIENDNDQKEKNEDETEEKTEEEKKTNVQVKDNNNKDKENKVNDTNLVDQNASRSTSMMDNFGKRFTRLMQRAVQVVLHPQRSFRTHNQGVSADDKNDTNDDTASSATPYQPKAKDELPVSPNAKQLLPVQTTPTDVQPEQNSTTLLSSSVAAQTEANEPESTQQSNVSTDDLKTENQIPPPL